MVGGHWIGWSVISKHNFPPKVRPDWLNNTALEEGEGEAIAAGFTCPYCGAKDAFFMVKREGEVPLVRCGVTKREFLVPLT